MINIKCLKSERVIIEIFVGKADAPWKSSLLSGNPQQMKWMEMKIEMYLRIWNLIANLFQYDATTDFYPFQFM